MNNLSVKRRIIDVLVSNQDIWLRTDEIAELAYGDAYIRDTKAILDSKVARGIHSAIADALKPETGIVIIGKRMPRSEEEIKEAKRKNITNGASEYHPMKSYKVATEQDKPDIEIAFKNNKEAIEAYIEKRNLRIGLLKSKKLLSPQIKDVDPKKLPEPDQKNLPEHSPKVP